MERKGERRGGIPSRSRRYVLTSCKVGNLICSWDAEQRESTGIVVGIGQVGKEAEQVLGVNLTTVKGARNIDTTLNIVS